MNKYVKNFILSTLNTVMTLLFPIITFPYVTKVLGPANLGIIDFAQSYGYYFTHIASFGISSYAIREVSRVRTNKDEVERVCNEIFNLNLFFSVLSTVLYFFGVFFVRNFRENFVIFAIYSLVILTNFLSLDWLLQSFDDYFFSTIRNLLIRILSIISVFCFVKSENDFIIYMIITCITEMGTKFSTLFYSRKQYAKLVVNSKYLNFADHIRSMFTLFFFRMVNGISSHLDKLMIGFALMYSDVNIYSTGAKFVLMIQPIVETVGIVLFPKINISSDSSEEYKKNLNINYNSILLMGIPMALGLFLVSKRLIMLITDERYIKAITVSRIMSPIILLGPIADMLGSKTLLVYKKDKELLLCSAIMAVSNIALNTLLIPKYQIYGAAFASLASTFICVALRYYFSRKVVKFSLINKYLFKYLLFTLPFIAIYMVFHVQIDNNNLWMFGFVALCALIYAIELLVSKDEFSMMILKKVFKRGSL